MNLTRSEDGEEFPCTNIFWEFILQTARKGGWEPLGTVKFDQALNKDQTWDGTDYHSNNGQVVTPDDAFNISKSLKKVIASEENGLTPEEHHALREFIEWLKIEDYEDDGIDYFPGFEIY